MSKGKISPLQGQQKNQNRVKLAALIGLTMMVQLFSPTAMAFGAGSNPPMVSQVTVPSSESYINVPGQVAAIPVSYHLDVNEAAATSIAVIEQIRDDKDNVVYEFDNFGDDSRTTNTYNFTWDGTYKIQNFNRNGSKVATGNYKFYVAATKTGYQTVTQTSSLFHVTYAVQAKMTLVSAASDYNEASGKYTITYNMDMGTATSYLPILSLQGSNGSTYKVAGITESTGGQRTFTWDGTLDNGTKATADKYSYGLGCVVGTPYKDLCNSSISGTLNITNTPVSTPTISNLMVDHNPYDPTTQGQLTLSFNTANLPAGTTLKANVVKDAFSTPVKSWTISSPVAQNTLTWNGISDISGQYAPNDTYKFFVTSQIVGADGNNVSGTPYPFTLNTSAQPNPQLPVISNLQVSPNPFDPTKGVVPTLTYAIDSTSVKLNLGVYDQSNSLVASWTSVTPGNAGTNAILWNASPNLNEGIYTFKVSGATNDNKTLVTQQITFTVQKGAKPLDTCAGFTDISASDPDCAALTYLKAQGVITGNPDGSFNPSGVLQRDQIAKIVLQSYKVFNSQSNYCLGVNPFFDVSPSEWSYQYICAGKTNNWITGYKAGADAGYYRPSRSVNRVEFLAIILRPLASLVPSFAIPNNTATSYVDVAVGQWFSGLAKASMNYNLFQGSYLYPNQVVTRREAAEVLYKLHNLFAKP